MICNVYVVHIMIEKRSIQLANICWIQWQWPSPYHTRYWWRSINTWSMNTWKFKKRQHKRRKKKRRSRKTMQNKHKCNVKTKYHVTNAQNYLCSHVALLLCNVILSSTWHKNCMFLIMHNNHVLEYILRH
jgi:hypothetical protein